MNKGMQRGMGFLVVLLLGIFLFSSFALAAYDDIGSYWGKDSIEKWSEKGIIEGTENHFRPGDKITRGEFAVILDRIMDYQLTSSVQFSDLGDKFYKDAILKCNKANVLQGSGDTVRPNDYITRQEAFVMICRAFYIEESNNSSADFADKSQISSWAMGSINALVNKGYIKGDKNKINPQGDLTRGEAVTLIDNIIEELYCKEAVYDKDVQGNLIINSNKVILRNMNIKGNLILAPGVNKDAVILDNVKIDGYIIISGGDNKLLTLQGKTSYNKLYIVKNGQLSEVKQNQEEAKKPVVEEDSPGGSTITSKQQIAFLGKKLEAEVAIAEPIIANRANLLVFWKEYTDHVTNAKRVITNIKYDSLKYLPEFDTPQEISALLDNIHTYNLLVKDYNDTYNNGNILKNRYVTYYPEENKAQYKLYYNNLLMRLDQVQKAAVYDAKIAD
ncbi:MAG: S-layer homology domain-containing protein, partial [Clostridiales bacterium]